MLMCASPSTIRLSFGLNSRQFSFLVPFSGSHVPLVRVPSARIPDRGDKKLKVSCIVTKVILQCLKQKAVTVHYTSATSTVF